MSDDVPLGRPSFANLITDEERLELDQWLHRSRGPWKTDLERYPPDYVEEVTLEELLGHSINDIIEEECSTS